MDYKCASKRQEHTDTPGGGREELAQGCPLPACRHDRPSGQGKRGCWREPGWACLPLLQTLRACCSLDPSLSEGRTSLDLISGSVHWNQSGASPSSMIKLCAFWQHQVSLGMKGSSSSAAVFLTNAVLYFWSLFFKRQNTRSFPFSLFLLNSICLQILRIYYTTFSHVLIPHPQILGPSTRKSIELGFCDTILRTGLTIS